MVNLSPLLREKLKRDPHVPIACVVEVRVEKKDYVLSQLRALGLSPNEALISQPMPGGNIYIPVTIPADLIEDVARIEGVVAVHKSMPKAAGGLTGVQVPFFKTVADELMGELRIPEVEVPANALFEALPNPLSAFKGLGVLPAILTGANPVSNVRIFPTSVTTRIIKDVSTRDGVGVTVAVLDTGSPTLTPQWIGKHPTIEEYSLIPFEGPQDLMSHGAWCHNCVCGGIAPSPYGMMEGVAPAVERSIHVKCLNTFPGAGSTEGILKAIEIAVKRGAKVISMSLGGPAQGDSVEGDIECKIVNELSKEGVVFCVAAGNSGSDLWTVGSPGAALKCISCASASIMDDFKPAYWSSRGPGSEWDRDHKEEWERLLVEYGGELIKPDVSCLGGGRASKDAVPDEVIWSGCSGWFEPFYDGLLDATGGMHGSSQSTPHVAGLIACALSDGVIANADDAKRLIMETAGDYVIPDPLNEVDKEYIERYGKSIAVGWGLLKLSRLRR